MNKIFCNFNKFYFNSKLLTNSCKLLPHSPWSVLWKRLWLRLSWAQNNIESISQAITQVRESRIFIFWLFFIFFFQRSWSWCCAWIIAVAWGAWGPWKAGSAWAARWGRWWRARSAWVWATVSWASWWALKRKN